MATMATSAILVLAMLVALVLLLKTTYCSEYKNINTRPVLTVVIVFIASYVTSIILSEVQESFGTLIIQENFTYL